MPRRTVDFDAVEPPSSHPKESYCGKRIGAGPLTGTSLRSSITSVIGEGRRAKSCGLLT